MNLAFLEDPSEHPFINMVKECAHWQLAGSAVDPGILDVNGYPISGAYVCAIPIPNRAGRTIVYRWTGNGVLGNGAQPCISGSTTPVLSGGIYTGRCVINRAVSGTLSMGAFSQSTPPISLLEVMWDDEEARYNAGEIFSQRIIDVLQTELRVGTLRFLDWQSTNISNATTWESNKSESYFSWAANEFRNVAAPSKPALWAGATTNSGADFSIALGSGGPADKQAIQLKWSASTASTMTSLGALSAAFSGAVSSDLIVNWTAHGVSVNDPVGFNGTSGTALPDPLLMGQNYYVSNVIDANSFNIALTSGGANIVRSSAGTSGSSVSAIRLPTLNLNAAGAIPIRIATGEAGGLFGSTQPTINRLSTLIYDADLASWVMSLGTTGGGSGAGLTNGVPPSVLLKLCIRVGAHCWLNVPYLALDPMTNYTASLAAYLRDNKPSWMKVRVEAVNENWNPGSGFYSTRYAWMKAGLHWGTSAGFFDNNDWYGKVVSTMGQDIQTAFSSDTSKYDVVLGVQASTGDGPTVNDNRMNSTLYVAQSAPAQSSYVKQPAYKYATQGSGAIYIQSNYYGFPTELSQAYDYAVNGNATALQNYVDGLAVSGMSRQNLLRVATRMTALGTYFAGPWGGSFVLGLMPYEGGVNAIPASATNSTAAITAATQDASGCVLTLPTSFINSNQDGIVTSNSPTPAAFVGMSVSISGVAGMTQLNGNTYTVSATSVGGDPLKIKINVDSSGFSAYTSGGTVVYVGATTNLNILRAAFRLHPSLAAYTYGGAVSNYQGLVTAGGTFPSQFDLSASSSAWGLYQPDLYSTPSPAATGIHNFNYQ